MGKDKGKEKVSKKPQELRKPSALIQMSNKITLQQRKAFNSLLFHAQEALKSDPNQVLFEINLAQIKDAMGIEHRTYDFLDRMYDLQHKTVVIDLLGKEKVDHNMRSIALIAEFRWNSDERSSDWTIKYQLPETIRERLLKRSYYAVLDLLETNRFTSKYAMALYELAKDYIDVEIPWMSIEKFRELMGVEDHEYVRVGDLIRRVLTPAQDEISGKMDIEVTSKFKKSGRGGKITDIKFHIKKKPMADIVKNPEYEILMSMLPPVYAEMKTVQQTIALYLKKEGREYVESNIQYAKKNSKTNLKKYLQDALKNDWSLEVREKEREMKKTEERLRDEAAAREARNAQRDKERQEQALQMFNNLSQEEKEIVLIKLEERGRLNPYFEKRRFESQLEQHFSDNHLL